MCFLCMPKIWIRLCLAQICESSPFWLQAHECVLYIACLHWWTHEVNLCVIWDGMWKWFEFMVYLFWCLTTILKSHDSRFNILPTDIMNTIVKNEFSKLQVILWTYSNHFRENTSTLIFMYFPFIFVVLISCVVSLSLRFLFITLAGRGPDSI